jgi:hypothetical protein
MSALQKATANHRTDFEGIYRADDDLHLSTLQSRAEHRIQSGAGKHTSLKQFLPEVHATPGFSFGKKYKKAQAKMKKLCGFFSFVKPDIRCCAM